MALALRMVMQPTTAWNMDAAEVCPMVTLGEFSIRKVCTSSVATQEVRGWLAPWDTWKNRPKSEEKMWPTERMNIIMMMGRREGRVT